MSNSLHCNHLVRRSVIISCATLHCDHIVCRTVCILHAALHSSACTSTHRQAKVGKLGVVCFCTGTGALPADLVYVVSAHVGWQVSALECIRVLRLAGFRVRVFPHPSVGKLPRLSVSAPFGWQVFAFECFRVMVWF